MQNSYNNGQIISTGCFYEVMKYNVSNEKISTIFDGKGAVLYYSEVNKGVCISRGASAIYKNGKHIDVLSKKIVKMLGRKQETEVMLTEGVLNIKQFLNKSTNGVFISYSLDTEDENLELEAGMNISTAKEYDVYSCGNVRICPDNAAIYIKLTKEQNTAKLFITFEETDITEENIEEKFDKALKECENGITDVKVPKGLSEEEKAMFYSCYFCALENYKEKDGYKGFMAGHVYLLPMRTYYRDSYYTVLPMYNGNCEKIRSQIVTLSKGIAEDGTCPSAVISDYSAYWGNHYDSPSFLAIMLYDYVRFTKDTSIINEEIDGVTAYQKAVRAIEKLSECERDCALLYKEGRYNKRDWADAVNRWGYVTYDEILYARAYYSLSKLNEIMGDKGFAGLYYKKFLEVKNAINKELWDDELGYYINFKNEEYTETNLSIDTVFAAIFGIADDDQAKRMLKNMENILEVKNNKDVNLPDFGVMCVYPPYSNVEGTAFRSSQPFEYHNGSNWPYLSAIYAFAKRKYKMEYKNALCSWFGYNIKRNNFTPIEYFSPTYPDGSLLQAWSGVAAFVLDDEISLDFWDND